MTSTMCEHGPPRSQDDFNGVLLQMRPESIALGVVLVVGSIISVIPQHVKIFKTRSAVGLSYLWLFLANLNQFSSFIAAVVLKYPQIQACSYVGLFPCLPSLLDALQLFVIWFFTFPIYIWFLWFSDPKSMNKRDWLLARVFFVLAMTYVLGTTLTATIFLNKIGECERLTIWYANAMGILSTVITFVQYIPQIYATYKTKSSGSFSVAMLLIQIPGSAVTVFYLIFFAHDEVYIWLSYVSTILQQLILLIMIFYFERKLKGQKSYLNIQGEDESSQGLLANVAE